MSPWRRTGRETFKRPHWLVGVLLALALFALAAIPLIYATDQSSGPGPDSATAGDHISKAARAAQ